jgi:aminopeptidase N
MNDFVTSNLPRAFSSDVGSSWSMNHYTEIPAELWSKFGAIGYQKSGCVLRMFQESLTPSTFAKGLNYYLTENYMKAATPEKLHASLQQAYDEDFPNYPLNIDILMSMWENQAGKNLIS